MITNNEVNLFTWNDLNRLDYNPDVRFQIELQDNQVLHVEKVLRLIPKRRIVVFGKWQNKSVAAKLFIDTPHAKRHLSKELHGLQALEKNKIPCPKIEFTGTSKDGRSQILILERIVNAKNLAELWQSQSEIVAVMPELKRITLELATQHVLGIVQKDLHLKNFLINDQHIYTLDGAEILVTAPLLPKKNSMQHLAILFSQLGAGMKKYQKELFTYYAKSRGWLLKKSDFTYLFELIKQHNQYRWQRYQEKLNRNCTDFAQLKTSDSFSMVNRHYLTQDFLAFLNQPESVFKKPHLVLKDGNSATVIKTKIGAQEFVVKRYNLKNIFHWMRRALRPTRAASSWMLANKLQLFGVATAKPIAFIEKRKFGLRFNSYYITEYISGSQAAERLQKTNEDGAPVKVIERIAILIKNLLPLNVTHGDLKISNILINEHDSPVLIDLDGAQEHRSSMSLRANWQKDVKRFLRNFASHPTLAKQFSLLLLPKHEKRNDHAIDPKS